MEDDLVGRQVYALVEAKKEDMEQGLSQCLIGTEVASELDRLDVVHGIITTYAEWHLTSSSSTAVTRDAFTLSMENGMPEKSSLQNLVGKIRSLLL